MDKGKIIYRPPEKCYSNCWIVENEHGFKVFRHKDDKKAMAFIPHNAVKAVEYRSD